MENCCTRKDFFRMMGLGTLGLGFGVSIYDSIYQYAEAEGEMTTHQLLMKGTVNFKGFMAKEITPNDEFYITTYSDKVPNINYEAFRLRIEGIVKAAFYAEEGYTDSIPYTLARSHDVFLAFRMNGEPLPKQHGYPLRVIVPGIYGMKHVKWLSKIELVNYNFKGYWEKRGWSDDAIIPIKSQILMPMEGKKIPTGNYVIGGIAFAGRYGISRVQISLDNKKTWKEAEIKKTLSDWSWVLWRYDWKPAREGDYTITVRGIDRSGKVQESPSLFGKLFGTFPDGAKGLNSVTVKMTG